MIVRFSGFGIDSGTKKSGFPPGFRVPTTPLLYKPLNFFLHFCYCGKKGGNDTISLESFSLQFTNSKSCFFWEGFCSKDVVFLQFFNSIHFKNIIQTHNKLYYLKTRGDIIHQKTEFNFLLEFF